MCTVSIVLQVLTRAGDVKDVADPIPFLSARIGAHVRARAYASMSVTAHVHAHTTARTRACTYAKHSHSLKTLI